MKQFDIIYKRTSTGAVQTWTAEVEGDRYRTISGQQNGKKTISEWTTAEAKNTGKSNATTAEEQAVVKVEQMFANKLAREYRRELAEIDNKHYTKPMKSVKWKDPKARPAPGTAIGVQPKLDGMRALTSPRGAKSQDGKIIPGFRHIWANLLKSGVFEDMPDLELDGEGYNHTHAEQFEGLMSALKDANPTPEEDAEIKKIVQYHLYDIASSPKPYAVFEDGILVDGRLHDLWNIYKKYLARFDPMFRMTHMIPGVMDTDGAFVDKITNGFLESKYEGAMVRIIDSKYENKTSRGLIKVKPMEDKEFLILRIEEGSGNWAGVAKRIIVQLEDGREQKTTPKGDKTYLKKMLEEKELYEGKAYGTVTFLRRTADGFLYLPIFKAVRWDYVPPEAE
jgi:hypothetical protein